MLTPLEAWVLEQLYELHDDIETGLTEETRRALAVAHRASAPPAPAPGDSLRWAIHDQLERLIIGFRARMDPADLAAHLAEP
jgi:hypothetical protein